MAVLQESSKKERGDNMPELQPGIEGQGKTFPRNLTYEVEVAMKDENTTQALWQ